MHELSLVASILEMVEQDARQRGIKRVTFIRVVAGEFASVNSRALTFALENVVKGTILEEAEVDFSVREAWETCPGCQEGFKPRPPFFQCPKCSKPVSAALVTKTDLLPYCAFDMNTATEDLQKINPDLKVFQVSCKSGEGLDSWYKWLDTRLQAKIKRGSG